jgi:hypothetical protein
MSNGGIIYPCLNQRVAFGSQAFRSARWHTCAVSRTPVLLAVFVAAAATAVAGIAAGGGTHAPPARLRLVDTDPVTLRATGFRPHEHVRITVFPRDQLVRRVTAGSGGSFTMRLPGVDLNNCTGFSVTATGNEGSRATFKRAPGVCAQP